MQNIFLRIIQKIKKPTLTISKIGNPKPKKANSQLLAGLTKLAIKERNNPPAKTRLLHINIFLMYFFNCNKRYL